MSDVLRITSTSGRVLVVGEQRAEIDVAGSEIAEKDGERIVRAGSKAITVRVPVRSNVVIGSASGDVDLQGQLGNVSVTTASGDIQADEVTSIDARTASGSLRVEASLGSVRLKTNGSTVHVHTVDGELRVATISGTIQVEHASASVSIRTVSGDVDLGLGATADANVETVSGTVQIVVPAGVRPLTRLRSISGTRHVSCEPGEDLEIAARSVSGDLSVRAAT